MSPHSCFLKLLVVEIIGTLTRHPGVLFLVYDKSHAMTLGDLPPALCAFIVKLLSIVGGEAKILKFLNQLKYVNLCAHTSVGPALAHNVNFEQLALILPQ